MRGLKRKINPLWSKLEIGKRSTTKRFKKAEQRCEEADRELSDMDRSTEDIQHQILCPQVSGRCHSSDVSRRRYQGICFYRTSVCSGQSALQDTGKLEAEGRIDASLVNRL
jgi:hypothetical protein